MGGDLHMSSVKPDHEEQILKLDIYLSAIFIKECNASCIEVANLCQAVSMQAACESTEDRILQRNMENQGGQEEEGIKFKLTLVIQFFRLRKLFARTGTHWFPCLKCHGPDLGLPLQCSVRSMPILAELGQNAFDPCWIPQDSEPSSSMVC